MKKSGADLADRAVALIEEARRQASTVVNLAMVYAYYGVGRMIVEEEQGGAVRAGYGQQLLQRLSKRMTAKLGGGFSPQNLANMKQFYLTYSTPQIFQTPSRKSVEGKSGEPVFALSWSHYLKLMRIEDPQERSFYELEARENGWSLRELSRQFDASLYERLALSRNKKQVLALARRGQVVTKPEEALKDPYVLEFTGLAEKSVYSETELETRLIDHLQEFLLELGKGFTFVGRQERVAKRL